MDITTTKEFDKIINDKERKAVLIDFGLLGVGHVEC